jgi:glutamyl-tRNA synthetase/glutamyl-Q tRNA(Asp) synthetase
VNALYTWGIARALGGTVLLRIEDHDRQRSRREYERGILEDLAWLNLEWDGDGAPPAQPFSRQSEHEASYRRALQSLQGRGLVYACACSRKEIEQVTTSAAGELKYPGTCRARGLPSGDAAGLRLRLDPGVERFDDPLMGGQAQDPSAQAGDLLIRDRVGGWTYQFAVTVDDAEQHVHLVIRGADLLRSTGRQIRLARLLGRCEPPIFLHHPLLYGDTGVKLSKSNGDTAVRELRAQGLSAEDVLGVAAAQAGLIERPRRIPIGEVPWLFRGAHVLQEDA